MMKIIWLGQAGILFEKDNVKIMVDPYFSNSCAVLSSKNERRMPVNSFFLSVSPDILIFTHEHLDHLDPETYSKILDTEKKITVLAPEKAWNKVRKFGREHNYVMFNHRSIWTENGIVFRAIYAEHSDSSAIGVIIEDNECTYYVTGDTLYNGKVVREVEQNIDVVFLPINGQGNNMNQTDAAKFAKEIGARYAVPIHWGMFDNINPEKLQFEHKIIPKIYKEIML